MYSSPIVVNSKKYCDLLSYVYVMKSEQLIFNDSSKSLSKIPQELWVFFACFFFVFPLLLLLFFFFYSSPDLNLCLYSPHILHDFSFKITKFSASDRTHPPQISLLSKTDMYSLVKFWCISCCKMFGR